MSDVTVIGLGAMGTALARTLIDNDYSITVWNRTPDKAAQLATAGAAVADSPAAAIAASPVTLICIKSNSDTRRLLESAGDLAGRRIIELSTGSAPEAKALAGWLRGQGADCLIGMICVFPRDIGDAESTIITVGDEPLWDQTASMFGILAGKSSYVGEDIGALAILYSALLLPRQGFMFGMIYGALLCRKAGLPLATYVEQMPLTIKVVHDYYDVFSSSVPAGNYDDPQASIDVYAAAFADTLESFREHGADDELPKLMARLLERGTKAGLGDKQITALIELLND
jgi:3-hydroxyisobutyrate dehydrogenase-like beta-hydroxyacid dehydrogenase